MQVSTSTSAAVPTYSPASGGKVSSSASQNLDKDDFLRLLVTQLRAQDPLEPVTNEAFVAQLAQFSSLEQMQNINVNLTDSLQANYVLGATINNSLATTLIGSSVKVAADEFAMTGPGTVECGVDLGTAFRRVSIDVYNEKNEVVRTISVDNPVIGENKMVWDGTNDQGADVAAGTYRLKVTAEAFDGSTSGQSPHLLGTISGVRYRDGGAILLLGNVEVMPSDIVQVQKP